MMPVWVRLLEAIDRHGAAAMVTLAAAKGSSPREPGARMIVNPDGTFTGTIGGGALEWQAIALAQGALGRASGPKAEMRRFALGPELGQCCGGQVDLLIEAFSATDRDAVSALTVTETRGPFATVGTVSVDGVARRVSDETIPPGEASYANGVLTEGFGDARRPLILFGAGHVGRALVLALAPLPFTLTWVDPRPDAFPAYVPVNVTLRRLDDPAAALAEAAEGAFVLVMTHSHPLDLALVEAALRDGRFGYVGLIGSATKRARFEKRLREAGIPDDRIAALVCPIGVGGIESKVPAVIAAATAAELLVRDEALRAAAAGNRGLPVRRAAG
jgi:xanthine dehydrogenase accessory factor